jgi:hypothetical protein
MALQGSLNPRNTFTSCGTWAVILALKRLRQKDPKFEASLGYIERPYLKINK